MLAWYHLILETPVTTSFPGRTLYIRSSDTRQCFFGDSLKNISKSILKFSAREPDWLQNPTAHTCAVVYPRLEEQKIKQKNGECPVIQISQRTRDGAKSIHKGNNINIYIQDYIHYRHRQTFKAGHDTEHRPRTWWEGALALVLQCFWFVQYFSRRQVQEAEWN